MIRRFTSAPKPAARVRPYMSATVSPGSCRRMPKRTPSNRDRLAEASAGAIR